MQKKLIIIASMIIMGASLSFSNVGHGDAVNSLKPLNEDIPAGFVIGVIPDFAKKVLKNNPWDMDSAAIKRMLPKLYPGANAHNVRSAHITILARQQNPYRDDIVCYVIQFTNGEAAKTELKKLEAHVGHNSDRSILLTHEQHAVYLFADKTENMLKVYDMADSIEKRITKLK